MPLIPRHPYHRWLWREDVPFKLAPCEPNTGEWGAYATKDIEKGTVILVEHPLLFFANKHTSDITKPDVDPLLSALSPVQTLYLEQLCFNDDPDRKLTDRATTFDQIMSQNNFQVYASDGSFRGTGLYRIASRFPHGCTLRDETLPKLIHDTPGDCVRITACEDIAEGELLLLNGRYPKDVEGLSLESAPTLDVLKQARDAILEAWRADFKANGDSCKDCSVRQTRVQASRPIEFWDPVSLLSNLPGPLLEELNREFFRGFTGPGPWH